jgi:hypothetical protein
MAADLQLNSTFNDALKIHVQSAHNVAGNSLSSQTSSGSGESGGNSFPGASFLAVAFIDTRPPSS